MNGAWVGAGDVLSLSAGPWRQGANGAWRVVAEDAVALSEPADDPDDLTDAEREALSASPEWQAYVMAEVDDIAARHGLT